MNYILVKRKIQMWEKKYSILSQCRRMAEPDGRVYSCDNKIVVLMKKADRFVEVEKCPRTKSELNY